MSQGGSEDHCSISPRSCAQKSLMRSKVAHVLKSRSCAQKSLMRSKVAHALKSSSLAEFLYLIFVCITLFDVRTFNVFISLCKKLDENNSNSISIVDY